MVGRLRLRFGQQVDHLLADLLALGC
jgi:hypothetical protein